MFTFTMIFEILGYWVLAGVFTVIVLNGLKRFVSGR